MDSEEQLTTEGAAVDPAAADGAASPDTASPDVSGADGAGASVLEEPADDLLAFVQGLVPVDWLSTLIAAVVIIVITGVIARLSSKLIRRVLSTDASPLPSSSIFVNIVRVAIWAIGVSIMLSTCFNVNVTAAVAALGVGGIAVSLGFQDTLSNLISGLQMSLMGLVEPGDYVEIGGQRGTVHDMTWRHTTIETSAGDRIIVPNSVINTSALVQLPPMRKVVVSFSIVADANADVDAISESIAAAANAAASKVGELEKEAVVLFSDVTAFGFTGSVIVWMDSDDDSTAAKDAIVRAIAPLTRERA